MAKTIEQLQAFIDTNPDLRQVVNELADYLQANPSGGSDPGYLEYVALLTQSGTDAPVATVLGTNTIGNIVWTRNAGGDYEGTLAGAFTANKTWLMISPSMTDPASGVFTGYIFIRLDNNTLRLQTIFAPDMSDGQLFEQSISIRVYP